MIDNVNPSSQFHPYQPVHDTPAIERLESGGILDDSLRRIREYARRKPGVVLGGLAALAIGVGLMRRRM
jgi:hypothetical protein